MCLLFGITIKYEHTQPITELENLEINLAGSTSLISIISILTTSSQYLSSVGIQKIPDFTILENEKFEFIKSLKNCENLIKLSFIGTDLLPEVIQDILFHLSIFIKEVQIQNYKNNTNFIFETPTCDYSTGSQAFQSLRSLTLSDCYNLTDYGLMQLKNMPSLMYLDLSATSVTCDVQFNFTLQNLETLKLCNCREGAKIIYFWVFFSCTI